MKEQKEKKSEDIKQFEKEIEENTETLKRLQAEFENHIKRTEKQKKEFVEIANIDLIKKLLPVIDDFENTIKHVKDEGIQILFNNFMKVLKDEGLKEIKADKLDPFLHEVVLQEESKEPEGTILKIIQKGYTLKNNVIRHSKVIVSKQEENKND